MVDVVAIDGSADSSVTRSDATTTIGKDGTNIVVVFLVFLISVVEFSSLFGPSFFSEMVHLNPIRGIGLIR